MQRAEKEIARLEGQLAALDRAHDVGRGDGGGLAGGVPAELGGHGLGHAQDHGSGGGGLGVLDQVLGVAHGDPDGARRPHGVVAVGPGGQEVLYVHGAHVVHLHGHARLGAGDGDGGLGLLVLRAGGDHEGSRRGVLGRELLGLAHGDHGDVAYGLDVVRVGRGPGVAGFGFACVRPTRREAQGKKGSAEHHEQGKKHDGDRRAPAPVLASAYTLALAPLSGSHPRHPFRARETRASATDRYLQYGQLPAGDCKGRISSRGRRWVGLGATRAPGTVRNGLGPHIARRMHRCGSDILIAGSVARPRPLRRARCRPPQSGRPP